MTAGTTSWGRNNNVRILRYSEVLLINAEAKVRNGKSGDASFNEVRTRAHMPTLTGVTLDQILDERRMDSAVNGVCATSTSCALARLPLCSVLKAGQQKRPSGLSLPLSSKTFLTWKRTLNDFGIMPQRH